MLSRVLAVLGVCLAVLSLMAGPVQAQVCPGVPQYDPYAYEALTVSTAVVPLSRVNIPPATDQVAMAFVTVEANTISYTYVGTPSATVGHQVVAGGSFTICGRAALLAFKAIRVSADATLKITYWKER